jgi:hypothetical protein
MRQSGMEMTEVIMMDERKDLHSPKMDNKHCS